MAEIVRYIILIILAVFAYRIIYRVIKRLKAVKEISSLKKICGARVRFTHCPMRSYFKPSKTPDAIVEVGDSVYLIRLISGGGSLHFIHFASPEYFVTYTKFRLSLGSLFSKGSRRSYVKASGSVNTSMQKVRIMPKLEIPEEYKIKSEYDTRKIVSVIVLSPEPAEVTFVTEKRNAIKAAFTGDEVYGQKIFTPATFAIYADRQKRQEEYEKNNSERGIFY